MKPEYKKKAIRSYVIRGGRITDGQKNAFDKYWPFYGLSLFDGKVDFDTLFPNLSKNSSLILEVGYGMGDSLLEMARKEVDQRFIGIEVHPPGVGRFISEAGKVELNNVKTYMADAIDVLEDCIPDACLDRFQLFFPDPWHKKKHNKRRILQREFLALVTKKLKPGGIFHMATDWQDYAEYACELMSLAEEFENTADEYRFALRPDYRPITKFEKRGEKLGHGVWDIIFRKRDLT